MQGLIPRQMPPKAVAHMMFTWIQGLIVHRIANPRSDFGDCKKSNVVCPRRLVRNHGLPKSVESDSMIVDIFFERTGAI